MERSNVIASWEDFTKGLLTRFGPSQFEDAIASLTKLRQSSTVEDYQTKFEELANRTSGLNESFMVSCFLGGLHEDIRLSVRMLQPNSLSNAVGLARLQEEKIGARRRRSYFEVGRFGPFSSSDITKAPTPAIKRLTPLEMKQRRSKGLCYNCDENFALGHKCKTQKLFLMEGNWPEDDGGGDTDDEDGIDMDSPEISLHAMTGSQSPQTMRVKGFLRRLNLMILVDTGSTHNFLSPRVANKLGLPISKDSRFEVVVANGDRIHCLGACEGVKLLIQVLEIQTDFFILQLGGYDAVLGAQWLRTLGPITWDFSKLTMRFYIEGRPHLWQGEDEGGLKIIKEGGLKHMKPNINPSYLLQFFSIIPETSISHPS